jgi:DNA-binding winged helix-turn-helix (wHTH) protein
MELTRAVFTLSPKESAVLAVLSARSDELVTYDALLDHAWPEDDVSISSLNRCISTLRRKLADGVSIRTHSRRGYSLRVADQNPSSTLVRNLVDQARENLGLRLKGNIQVAIRLLQEALLLSPEHALARLYLAEVYGIAATRGYMPPRLAGKRARETLFPLLQQDPDNAHALSLDGRFRVLIEGDSTAREDIDRAVELAPMDWLVMTNAGIARAGLGDLAGAIAACESALALNPAAPGAIVAFGWSLFASGDWIRARALLEDAVRQFPSQVYFPLVLSFVLSSLKSHSAAVAAARRALFLSGGDANARAALVSALALAGQKEKAWRELNLLRASDQLPPSPTLLARGLLVLEGPESLKAAILEAEDEGCPYRTLPMQDRHWAAPKAG